MQTEGTRDARTNPSGAAGNRARPLAGSTGKRNKPPLTDQAANRQEKLLDEALEESFPASDPISVYQIGRDN